MLDPASWQGAGKFGHSRGVYASVGDIQRFQAGHAGQRRSRYGTGAPVSVLPACEVYGFHDLRRGYATMNADTMTADALQALMRHKDYSTTKRYINIGRQLNLAVDGLHVPDVLKRKKARAATTGS